MSEIVQVKRLADVEGFSDRVSDLGIDLPIDPEVERGGPLAAVLTVRDGSAGERTVGNRFTILPMEGWDGTDDGRPTDLVRRRWRRFGESGAKLIWGCEAVAVDPSGRANPHQLTIGPSSVADLAALRSELVESHAAAYTDTDDLMVGLQLTHSGRWSRPSGEAHPLTAWTHPVLDTRSGADATSVLSDDDLDVLVDRFVHAAVVAADAGFDFVDIKHCHGYLLHELLGTTTRTGRYGGDLDTRLAFLTSVTERIRAQRPELAIGVRLSAFDVHAHEPGSDGRGRPVEATDVTPFGADPTGLAPDLNEVHRVLERFTELGIGMVCVTAGSPYYNPHIQRPAFFPPSDGYTPPRDPLVDVARLLAVTAELTREHSEIAIIGSGYSYLQDFLGHVAQAAVRRGEVDSVGLGRMALSYPTLPADLLAGRTLQRRAICRTFSDCTTAPRHGLVSGCYPLDDLYKQMPERIELAAIKKRARAAAKQKGRPSDRL